MSQQPPPDAPGWGQPAPGPGPGWGQPTPAPGPGWGAPAPAPNQGWDPGHAPQGPGQPPGPGYPPQGPGYPPQPGFGGPGGPPSGANGGSKAPLVIVLVLVAAAIGVGAFFLLSGSDGDGDSPESVATRFIDAVADLDCGAAVDLIDTSGQPREELLDGCEETLSTMAEAPDDVATEVPEEVLSAEVVAETDTTATVEVEYRTRGGSTSSEEFELVKVDAGWRVAGDALGVGGGSTPSPTPDGGEDDVIDGGDDSDGSDDGSSGPPLDSDEAIAEPELAADATACSEGDMVACDDLYWATDSGGELEAYAKTCGGRAPAGDVSGSCEETYG